MTRTVVESKTKTVIIGFDGPFAVIGERTNPTGRKKLAAEMEADNFETVIRDALEQVACGATILDAASPFATLIAEAQGHYTLSLEVCDDAGRCDVADTDAANGVTEKIAASISFVDENLES